MFWMNRKGSALIWVVSILMIFVILVTGILVLVGSSHRNAMYNNHKQQAYFTAKSAADAVAYVIRFNGAEEYENAAANLIPTPAGVTWTNYSIRNLMAYDLGQATIEVKREDANTIIIRATATYMGVEDRVSLYLYGESYEEAEVWEIWKYEN